MAQLQGHSIEEQWDLAEQFELRMEHSINEVITQFLNVSGLTAAVDPDSLGHLGKMWEYQVDQNLAPFVYATYSSSAAELQFDATHSFNIPTGTGVPGVPDQFTADFVAKQTPQLKGISTELTQHIQEQLAAGAAAGETVEQLANRVRQAADLTMPRALTIARTQVMAASNAGSFAQASLIADSTMMKQWLATEDIRTRPDHNHADYQTVPMLEKFTVGGWLMDHPGDFMAPAGEVVNCRCTLGYNFNGPPANLCACGEVNEAALISAGFTQSKVNYGTLDENDSYSSNVGLPINAPSVVENCACPVTSMKLTTPAGHYSKLTDYSYLQQKDVYQTFKGEQNISPAYGGAKIHKQLQTVHEKFGLTSDDDSIILNIVDNFYGKSSFKAKYQEWLDSAAGKKAVAKGGTVKPTIVKQPEVPAAPVVIDPLDISSVPQQAVDKLYALFKSSKPVTPNWGGSAILKNLDAIKSQLVGPEWSSLNDGQLLKMLDKAYGKGTKNFYDEAEKWLQTPQGKKYLTQTAKPDLPKPLVSPKPMPVEKTLANWDKDFAKQKYAEAETTYKNAQIGYVNQVAYLQVQQGKTFEQALKHVSDLFGPGSNTKTLIADPNIADILKAYGEKNYLNTDWIPVKDLTMKNEIPIAPSAVKVPDIPAGDISQVANWEQQALYTQMKKLGAYIASPPEKVFKILQDIKKTAAWKKYDFNDLQLLKIMDNQSAIKFGAENQHLYEKKIADWLQTPSGKDFATKNEYVKPKPYKAKPMGPVEEAHEITPVSQSQGFTPVGKTKYGGTKASLSLSDLQSIPRIIEKYTGNDADYPVFSTTNASSMWKRLGGDYNTLDGKTGLHFYTGEYTQINGGLRTGMHIEPLYIQRAKQAMQAMKPSDRPMMLHRGTGGLSFGLSETSPMLADMQKFIGKTVQDDGFISTSVGGSAAFSHKPIILQIRAPRGTPMAWAKPISQYSKENEMTLAPGTKFKILSVTQKGSQILVDVVVVP